MAMGDNIAKLLVSQQDKAFIGISNGKGSRKAIAFYALTVILHGDGMDFVRMSKRFLNNGGY